MTVMNTSERDTKCWKIRAECAEQTILNVTERLGSAPYASAILERLITLKVALKTLAIVVEQDPGQPDFRREFAREILRTSYTSEEVNGGSDEASRFNE